MHKTFSFLLFLFMGIMIGQNAAISAHLPTRDQDFFTYVPILMKPAFSTGSAELRNPSFEEGWQDIHTGFGNLINQQPNRWLIHWLQPGEFLWDSNDTVGGVPECIHKLADQLPPNEQPGGPDALILDGEATFKMFHFGAPFGVELIQTIYGMDPGATWQLIVPMQVHLHGDTDPYSAETGVWINGVGGWVNGLEMGDRQWYEHANQFTVPANGTAEIVVRVKSKWWGPKDFFIDHLRIEPVDGTQSSESDNMPIYAFPLELDNPKSSTAYP